MKTEKTLTVLRRVLKALILIIVGVILLANLYCLAAGRIFKVKAPTVVRLFLRRCADGQHERHHRARRFYHHP